MFTRAHGPTYCSGPSVLTHCYGPVPANERTYLSYLRTSSALAQLGIVVAQLFRLQERLNPAAAGAAADAFFHMAIPVGGTCIGFAVVISLAGGFRFWRQQNALARGKCHAGGWEPQTVGVLATLVRDPKPTLCLEWAQS